MYLPNEHHKYFLELIYLLSSNNKEQFNNLLNTIINKFGKTKLIKNVETINQNFNDCYILVFFELFKKYKNLFNDFKMVVLICLRPFLNVEEWGPKLSSFVWLFCYFWCLVLTGPASFCFRMRRWFI